MELRSGCDVDVVMDLEVHEAIALENMEFISDVAWVTESKDAELRWDMWV